MIGKHMEGRANNFKEPINISRFPCFRQWDIFVACYGNISDGEIHLCVTQTI